MDELKYFSARKSIFGKCTFGVAPHYLILSVLLYLLSYGFFVQNKKLQDNFIFFWTLQALICIFILFISNMSLKMLTRLYYG
jgi:hypothetical protein